MKKSQSDHSSTVWKKIIFWAVITVSALILIKAILILCLPMLISSSWFKQIVSKQASQSLEHPVQIQDLSFAWSDGLRLQGLRLNPGQGSDQKELLTLNLLNIRPKWGDLLKKRFSIAIELIGLDLRFVRYKTGQTNWDFLLKKAEKKPVPKEPSGQLIPGAIKFKLPIDLGCQIRMDELSFQATDLTTDQKLVLNNLSLSLDMPSLKNKPIMAKAKAKGTINGQPIPPVELDLNIGNLLDNRGLIDPQKVTLQLLAKAPGALIDISGGLGKEGISGQIDINPGEILSAAGPLLPDTLPEVDGAINIKTRAVYISNQDLQAELDLKATDLSISGANIPGFSGNLGSSLQVRGNPKKELTLILDCQGTNLIAKTSDKKVGPLKFKVSQKGAYRVAEGLLTISSGRLNLQEQSYLLWTSQVSSLLEKSPDIDFRLTKGQFDLHEILALGRPFLSDQNIFEFTKKLPALFKIKNLKLKGQPPPFEQHITLDQAKILLPPVQVRSGQNKVRTGPLSLSMHNSTIKMKSAFPTEVQAMVELQAENIHMSGLQNASVARINLADLHLVAEELSPNKKSALGLIGSFGLSQKGQINGIKIQNTAGISRIDNQLNLNLQLNEDDLCLLGLKDFQISIPKIKAFIGPGKSLQTNLNLVSSGQITFDPSNPISADIKALNLKTSLGELLSLDTSFKAQKLGYNGLQSEGMIRINPGEIQPMLKKILPKESSLAGKISLDWNLAGRRPGKQKVQKLIDHTKSLNQKLSSSEFLEKLKLKATIKDLDLNWPVTGLGLAQVRGITTKTPFTLSLNNGLKQIQLSAGLDISEIKDLPGLKGLDPPLGLSLALDGSVNNLEQLRLTEQLRLKPWAVTQTAQIILENIDSLLGQEPNQILPAALSSLQARISGSLEADFQQPYRSLASGLSIGNQIEAGLKAELVGGEHIDLDLHLTSPGLVVNLQDLGSISGLQSNLRLSKTYQLRLDKSYKPEESKEKLGLSNRVLNPSQQKEALSFESRQSKHHKTPYWARNFNLQPDLSLSQANLQALPLPVKISNLTLQTSQHRGVPGIENFQIDLWSGTIMGKARILPRDNGFLLDLACSFSGLDAAAALPARLHPQTSSETQLSGQIILELPLEDQIDQILQNLNLNLNLTHIGSQTLQQFLYAMDPTGSNEAIVKQRKLLETGRPKLIKLAIDQGSLSLTGKVEVKGIDIQLPPIERFRISELPIKDRLSNLNVPLKKILDLLHMVAAQEIVIDSDNNVHWIGSIK